MWQFLETVENSGFATFIRETPSVLGYSTVLALHTFGMAFLVGLSGVIALRVLGLFRELPIAPLERFFPLIVIGFWVNAATGVILTTLAARSLLTNIDFYVKLVAIVGAIVCLRRLKVYAFEPTGSGHASEAGRRWAAAMMACWGVAIVAGRLTAYTNYVRIRTVAAVAVATVLLFAARVAVLRLRQPVGRPLADGIPAATR